LYYENRNIKISLCTAYDNYVYLCFIMPVHKKIIKISKEEYERLNKDYSYLFDLYMSDNIYYVIGTTTDLQAAGVTMPSPY
jgi:hypothetical protein